MEPLEIEEGPSRRDQGGVAGSSPGASSEGNDDLLLPHGHGHHHHDHGSAPIGSGLGSQDLTRRKGFCSCMRGMDPTLLWTLFGVLVGTLVGIGLNVVKASSTLVSLTGFPGRCWLNTLKLLVLPLLSLSIVQGVSSLGENKRAAGRVCRLTLGYYFLTTTTAVLIGIVVVNLDHNQPILATGKRGVTLEYPTRIH